MHPVIYYMLGFLAIGGIGMAIANRKVGPEVKKQRWLKYFTYIFITGTIIASLLYNFFFIIASIIAFFSLVEFGKVNSSALGRKTILSLTTVLVIAISFYHFTYTFTSIFIIFTYFQVLVFDGFCQITGQLFGKHQLAPRASPSKTWEGLVGGWLFCIIAALLGASWLSLSFSHAAMFGIFTGLTSSIGDLLASWYKRKIHVKDYSNWLPGQGGFLDRFDSFLFTGAVYYLLFVSIFKAGLAPFTQP
jgi:phosphatidate cytidylyltransferase